MMGQALYLYSNIRVPIFQFVHIYGHLLQLQGLFKGGFSTLLRECTGNSVFFMTYEFTRYRLLSALKYHEARKLLAEPWQKDLYGKSYSKIIVEGVVDVISGGLSGMMVRKCNTCIPFYGNKMKYIYILIHYKMSLSISSHYYSC